MARWNETYLDLFDKHFNGELHGQDLDKFNHKLKHDEDFKKSFAVFQTSVEGIKAARKQELVARLQALDVKSKPAFNIMWLAIPAAAMVIFSLTWLFFDYYEQNESSEVAVVEETGAEIDSTEINDHMVIVDSTAIDSAEIELAIQENIQQPEVTAPRESRVEVLTVEDDVEIEEEMDMRESEVVKKDVLLSTAIAQVYNYPINDINPTRSTSQDEIVSVEKLSKKERKKARRNKKNEDAEEFNAPESASDKPAALPQASPIKVEYWSSVVNFRGYVFTGRLLKIYGYTPSKISVHSKANAYILQLDNQYYAITPDGASKTLPPPISKPAFIP